MTGKGRCDVCQNASVNEAGTCAHLCTKTRPGRVRIRARKRGPAGPLLGGFLMTTTAPINGHSNGHAHPAATPSPPFVDGGEKTEGEGRDADGSVVEGWKGGPGSRVVLS